MDRIIKNYTCAFLNKRKNNARRVNLSNFTVDGLRFSKEQLPIFQHISDCIVAHNIYKSNEKTVSLYKNYYLIELIGDNFRLFSPEANPLLYILAVADTIDPVKHFSSRLSLSPKEILDNVSFDYIPGSRRITISAGEKIKLSSLIDSARDLSSWTIANMSRESEKSFDLTL